MKWLGRFARFLAKAGTLRLSGRPAIQAAGQLKEGRSQGSRMFIGCGIPDPATPVGAMPPPVCPRINVIDARWRSATHPRTSPFSISNVDLPFRTQSSPRHLHTAVLANDFRSITSRHLIVPTSLWPTPCCRLHRQENLVHQDSHIPSQRPSGGESLVRAKMSLPTV